MTRIRIHYLNPDMFIEVENSTNDIFKVLDKAVTEGKQWFIIDKCLINLNNVTIIELIE